MVLTQSYTGTGSPTQADSHRVSGWFYPESGAPGFQANSANKLMSLLREEISRAVSEPSGTEAQQTAWSEVSQVLKHLLSHKDVIRDPVTLDELKESVEQILQHEDDSSSEHWVERAHQRLNNFKTNKTTELKTRLTQANLPQTVIAAVEKNFKDQIDSVLPIFKDAGQTEDIYKPKHCSPEKLIKMATLASQMTKAQYDQVFQEKSSTVDPSQVNQVRSLIEKSPIIFATNINDTAEQYFSLFLDKALAVDPKPGTPGYARLFSRLTAEMDRENSMLINKAHIQAGCLALELLDECDLAIDDQSILIRPLVATAPADAPTGIGIGDIHGTQYCGDACGVCTWNQQRHIIAGDKTQGLKNALVQAIEHTPSQRALLGSTIGKMMKSQKVVTLGGKVDFKNNHYEQEVPTAKREFLEETGLIHPEKSLSPVVNHVLMQSDIFPLVTVPNTAPRTTKNQAWVTTQVIIQLKAQALKAAVLSIAEDDQLWHQTIHELHARGKVQALLLDDALRTRIQSQHWEQIDINEILAVLGLVGGDDIDCIAALPVEVARFKSEHKYMMDNLRHLDETMCEQLARPSDAFQELD